MSIMEATSHDRGEGIGYQKAEWKVQRIGWAVMLILVLASLIGALGNSGPVAKASLQPADGTFELRYTRLQHHHAPASLEFDISPAVVQNGEVQIWMDADYAKTLSIESIIPEPDGVEVGPERVLYTFKIEAGDAPFAIIYQYQHDGYWWLEGRVGVENGGSVNVRQFIFP
jgi:hypothetical protein